jgi:uncharacterized membrane protein
LLEQLGGGHHLVAAVAHEQIVSADVAQSNEDSGRVVDFVAIVHVHFRIFVIVVVVIFILIVVVAIFIIFHSVVTVVIVPRRSFVTGNGSGPIAPL